MFFASFVTYFRGGFDAPRGRAPLRAAYAGSRLTPTACAILALTVAALALAAMLSASSLGNELDRAMRLSWWFS